MADAPKKKRASGPRVVKDKVAYLLFRGDVEPGSIKVEFDADKVMEAMDGDGTLKRARVVIPVKRKAPAPAAA